MYWLEGYGGGIWLPFADATSGADTYGGGRYLYDTIKGADLGAGERELVLDFNYAYNPSCAYDERWSCPLPPAENRLPFAVPAGERFAAGLPRSRRADGSTFSRARARRTDTADRCSRASTDGPARTSESTSASSSAVHGVPIAPT